MTSKGRENCIIHKPTLEDLKSKTFLEYIRNTVLATVDKSNHDCDDKVKLSQGMAKIDFPEGFFAKFPYGDDRTGRINWGVLEERLTFESPIQQNVRGMAGIYEYTHTDLASTNLRAFRERADAYYQRAVGTDDPIDDIEVLERQFWKRLGPTMPPAIYGADEPGSLFNENDTTGWSLRDLDSVLHLLEDTIPGVTSPYLYAGMWASVFCAHTEDMNLLSINYLHAGAPKVWYSVAEPDANRFVSLAKHHYSHQSCSEFLRHKRCLLSPIILQKAGIRYQFAVQYPGQAMVTFPGSYHFGFNTGFNVAEATNFGVPEWIPFGNVARVCLCRPDSVQINMIKLAGFLRDYEIDASLNDQLTYREWRKQQNMQKGKEPQSPTTKPMKKKRKQAMSEQQRRKEFWVEIAIRQYQKTDIWKLAKPLTRKAMQVDLRVLCLVSNDIDDTDEDCYTGRIVDLSGNHVKVHLDKQLKSRDFWLETSTSKLFLDGGTYKDEQDGVPALHYWDEQDSKKRLSGDA